MSILTEDLPTTLLGVPIRTDYRVMVTVELLLRDPALPPAQKIFQALDRQDPQNLPAALKFAEQTGRLLIQKIRSA